MQDKGELRKGFEGMSGEFTKKELEEYANWMADKYSTIKKGANVIHLDYYHGLIDDNDIEQIENIISKADLELSRFDKNGVPYNSLQDFTLQVSIFLSDPIVQSVLFGLGTNALWDAIKQSAILVWRRLKLRLWSLPEEQRKAKINFGLKVQINSKTSIDLKLDGEVSETTTLEAFDKAIDLIRSVKSKNKMEQGKLFIYNSSKKSWEEVDVMAEIRKIAENQAKERRK